MRLKDNWVWKASESFQVVAIHSLLCWQRACGGRRGFLCPLHHPSPGPVPSGVRCGNVGGKHTGISSQTVDEETEAEGGGEGNECSISCLFCARHGARR